MLRALLNQHLLANLIKVQLNMALPERLPETASVFQAHVEQGEFCLASKRLALQDRLEKGGTVNGWWQILLAGKLHHPERGYIKQVRRILRPV